MVQGNDDEEIKKIFLNLVRIRENLILMHVDQKDIPFKNAMTDEERRLYEQMACMFIDYNTDLVGDLL